jgi:hypothetical protein
MKRRQLLKIGVAGAAVDSENEMDAELVGECYGTGRKKERGSNE